MGASGTYFLCRSVGTGRAAALIGALVFALVPENASLINAGHAQKIATISFAPWAFYFLERGYQSRRVIFFLTTAVVLAFQFFNMHWQIAFYTCLAIGVYGVCRTAGILVGERESRGGKGLVRLLGLNAVILCFFLSTVAISLLPLADWSKETTRGVQSGSNQGQGGLQVEEAMSWSMPPEETITFVIPGFFGLSRQEGAYDDPNHGAYYWGRMVFTQTTDYMGLLPWLLVPLPLIFRRDRYTWLALGAVVGGLFFSFGKYTPFYWFLYEYFPGIDHFRVPKMMMFITALGLAVFAARGADILLNDDVRSSVPFRRYLAGVVALAPALLAILGIFVIARPYFVDLLSPMITQPTRFEQGPQMIALRWQAILRETGVAAAFAVAYGGLVVAWSRGWLSRRAVFCVLVILFLADVGRVNAKFMLLQDLPEKVKGAPTPVVEFLSRMPKTSRVLPLDGTDPMEYVSHGIPVMFTSNPVQVARWQDFLDAFSFNSAMPDMMNVRYLVHNSRQYEQDRQSLGQRYRLVSTSPDASQVILENRAVLPKAWLSPGVLVATEPNQILGVMQNPSYNPLVFTIVERQPPIPMEAATMSLVAPAGMVDVTRFEPNDIDCNARVARNSLLVFGEKYHSGWKARVDGVPAEIHRVNYILRGIYLTPGEHRVELHFDPLPFKVGKYLTLASFAIFAVMLGREWWLRRRGEESGQ